MNASPASASPASASPASLPPASAQLNTVAPDTAPGFAARGRLRRRVRFLRKARELAYRDLGGLVYNLHHFGQRNDQLVLGKLTTLGHLDTELRTLESALHERQPVTVLREAGLTACPRCAAIHSSEDRFCPNCGLPLSRNVDLPIAGPPTAPAVASAPAPGPPPATPARTQAPPPAVPSAAHTTPPAPTAPSLHTSRPPASPPGERAADDQPTEVVRPPSGGA
jgi:hypothetical protein